MNERIIVSPDHRPFEVRKLIIVLSLLATILFVFIFQSFWIGGMAYCMLAVALDLLIHKGLKFKASYWSVPSDLLKSENITPPELDVYFQSRLHIRLVAFWSSSITAVLSALTPYGWASSFCYTYIGVTLLAIFYVCWFTKRKRPIIFRMYAVDQEDGIYFPDFSRSSAFDDYDRASKDLIHSPTYSLLPGNIYNSTTI